jgi:hypothetical protein
VRGQYGEHAHGGEQVCVGVGVAREERFKVGGSSEKERRFGAGTGPEPAIDVDVCLCSPAPLPLPTPAMSAQTLELLIIAYGSRDTDSIGDDRYGAGQRRFEIVLRPNCRARA